MPSTTKPATVTVNLRTLSDEKLDKLIDLLVEHNGSVAAYARTPLHYAYTERTSRKLLAEIDALLPA